MITMDKPLISHCGAPGNDGSCIKHSASLPSNIKCSRNPLIVRSSKLSELMHSSVSNSSYAFQDWSSSHTQRSFSTLSLKSDSPDFFCNWYPILFGIDEDDIPLSEKFDEEWEGEFEEEKGRIPTISQLEMLRVGSNENLTDDELIKIWKSKNEPKYGRRARAKPILQRNDGAFYECLCDTDNNFERHYIPNFGGANPYEKDKWRTPHFTLYWQDLHDREAGITDDDAWLAELEFGKLKPEVVEEKIPYIRPTPKFEIGKRDQKHLRERTLASLRPLDCREIRRYRMPYAQAILLELQEDGFLEAADFFNEVITHEKCPKKFKKNQVVINKFSNALKEYEKRGRRDEKNKQSVIYVKLGRFFEDDESYWWLSENLYEKAVKVCENYLVDSGRSEAVARFAFGMFLLNNLGKINEARVHLSKARELSLGKDWNASTILNAQQDSVNKECMQYLCQALIAMGKQLRENGQYEEALSLIHQSYKLLEEGKSSKFDLKVENVFELGMVYQSVGMLDWAKSAFKKFITMAKAEGNKKLICDGYLQLAVCFRSEGNLYECEETLNSYQDAAIASGDKILQGFANRYFGEFNLNKGNSKEGAVLLEKSFNLFHEQYSECAFKPFNEWTTEEKNLSHHVELTRCLTGLAKGQLLTRAICELILKARQVRNQEDTLKLLKWKHGHEVEFEEDTYIPQPGDSYILQQEDTSLFQILEEPPSMSTIEEQDNVVSSPASSTLEKENNI